MSVLKDVMSCMLAVNAVLVITLFLMMTYLLMNRSQTVKLILSLVIVFRKLPVDTPLTQSDRQSSDALN